MLCTCPISFIVTVVMMPYDRPPDDDNNDDGIRRPQFSLVPYELMVFFDDIAEIIGKCISLFDMC